MIQSLADYQAAEAHLKELLASFAGAGDLVDANQDGLSNESGNWQGLSEKITTLKDEMAAYRETHPEEFNT